jgi:F420-dependent oxidoreductase-like protein
MRLSVWPNPQQPFADVLAVARHADETGWDGVWFADHFMPNAEDVSGAYLECWTTMAALAQATQRVRIGALVSGNTYRHPAVLAKQATTVNEISDGRTILGIGAGWQENEHAAYGIPFYDVKGRLQRLEEACQLINSLLKNGRSTIQGQFYQLAEAPLEPKRTMPILVGGGGEKVTMRIAAQYADEWNVWGTPELLQQKNTVLDDHCQKLNRDPNEIQRSANALLFMSDDDDWLAKRKANAAMMPSIIGRPEEMAGIVDEYAKAGVDELIVPDFTLGPLDRKLAAYDSFLAAVRP